MLETTPSYRISTSVVACLCYATCSTTITLANKYIFSHQFNYPWTLLAIQSTFVSVFLIIFQLFIGARTLSLTLMRQMLLPCLLFTVFIFSNSQALRFVSLPVLSVIKSLAPMGIALVEKAMFGDTMSSGTASAMLMIVVGNAVTLINDMDYSLKGYVWATGNVAVNIAYVVSLRACLSENFSPIEKAIHSNVTAATIMLPLSFASGETLPFLHAIKQTDTFFRFVFMVSCVFAAGIGASVFWVVQTSSGSTLSFVGSCNKFLVVILGGLLFKTRIKPIGWLSVALGVLAGVMFTVAKTRDSEQASFKNRLHDKQEDDEKGVTPKRHRTEEAHDVVDISSEGEENDRVTESLIR